jgi:dTDP-4-amino-4,6-dideoxygalactose transaminase
VPQNRIPFTKPDLAGGELEYLAACLESHSIAGDGAFTARCRAALEAHYQAPVLLTHSCTAALEMAAMLTVEPGDEVIMPSYTFVSTANAFVLRGAIPVFVDIRADTLNINEAAIEAAIGPRTRAIVPVHYAGVGCEMDTIMAIADRHKLVVIEDAAQAYCAAWNGRPLGSFGALAALSFHQTKNVVSGEGGLLIINDRSLLQRANIIREKGTNRTEFIRGEVDKYEWLDIGSSYLPSDLIAAVLLAQLEHAERITAKRKNLWNRYHASFAPLEQMGVLRRPAIPANATHNAHIYYVLFGSARQRDVAYENLRTAGISGSTHYVPLHSAPAGRRYGRSAGSMEVTDRTAATMLRLPLHGDITERDIDQVVEVVTQSSSRGQ